MFLLDIDVCLVAQTNNAIINSIASDPRPIASFSKEDFKFIEIVDSLEPTLNQLQQSLIKSSSELYVSIAGTGKLYKATRSISGIEFKRIDSTVYAGHNFGAVDFSYRDTIYSLGGYGFWKTNGLLRYFVEKRNEWEIVSLNQEIPFLTGLPNDLIWFDQHDGVIYLGFINPGKSNNDSTKVQQGSIIYESWKLDLNSKKWSKLGELDSTLRNMLPEIHNISSSPFGQMISVNGTFMFLDYGKNSILTLSENKKQLLSKMATINEYPCTSFFKDSMFYIGKLKTGLLDSVQISVKDLVDTKMKIFTVEVFNSNSNGKSNQFTIVGTVLLTLLIMGIVLFFFIRKKTKEKLDSKDFENTPSGTIDIFNELELEVIRLLLKKSTQGNTASIEELNKILGVTKKTIDIQKKQRSEIIASINKKYRYSNRTDDELVKKKRATDDGRSFEYFIDYDASQELKKVISPDV